MCCFKSSEFKFFSRLKCASTEISTCGEDDKPGSNYHSDDTTTICAFKPGVDACFVSKLLYWFWYFLLSNYILVFFCHDVCKLITPLIPLFQGDSGTAVEYNGLLHGIIVSNPVDKCVNRIVMLDICYYREWIDKTMQDNSWINLRLIQEIINVL